MAKHNKTETQSYYEPTEVKDDEGVMGGFVTNDDVTDRNLGAGKDIQAWFNGGNINRTSGDYGQGDYSGGYGTPVNWQNQGLKENSSKNRQVSNSSIASNTPVLNKNRKNLQPKENISSKETLDWKGPLLRKKNKTQRRSETDVLKDINPTLLVSTSSNPENERTKPIKEVITTEIGRDYTNNNKITEGYGLACRWERPQYQTPSNPREKHLVGHESEIPEPYKKLLKLDKRLYHADVIDRIYIITGEDKHFHEAKKRIKGKEEALTISETPARDPYEVYRIESLSVITSNVDMLDLYKTRSAKAYNEYTNLRSAFLVRDDKGMPQVSFVNYMMGHFIKGTGSENYIFPEKTKMSILMRSAGITKRALKEWAANGKQDNYFTKIEYTRMDQLKNLIADTRMNYYDSDFIPFMTVENFVGSADFNILYTADKKSILVTLTNVTSLTSGDLFKHVSAHGPWPNSKPRNPCNPLPQPYTNISQTFNMRFVLNDYFYRDINTDRIDEPY